MKYLLYSFLFLVSCNYVSYGQIHPLPEEWKGEWVMEKTELIEEPLYQPNKALKKTHTSIPETEQSPFFRDCILYMVISRNESQDERNTYIQTPSMEYLNPEIILENGLLSIKTNESNPLFWNYSFTFQADNHLVLQSLDTFYNNASGKPMKASFIIYLHRKPINN